MNPLNKLLLEEREILNLLIYQYEVEPNNEAKRVELREALTEKSKKIEQETKKHIELIERIDELDKKFSKMLEEF
jgi:hypothetical protein